MATRQITRTITLENLREAQALMAIWQATYQLRKLRGLHTQAAFGKKYAIGNQSAVGFFLHGDVAISIKAARGFALGLNCRIADFAPRLAAFETQWPFPHIAPTRFFGLKAYQQTEIQAHVRAWIERYETVNRQHVPARHARTPRAHDRRISERRK